MDGDNKRIQTKLTLRRLEARTHKNVNSFDATRHIKRWQKTVSAKYQRKRLQTETFMGFITFFLLLKRLGLNQK